MPTLDNPLELDENIRLALAKNRFFPDGFIIERCFSRLPPEMRPICGVYCKPSEVLLALAVAPRGIPIRFMFQTALPQDYTATIERRIQNLTEECLRRKADIEAVGYTMMLKIHSTP